MGGSECHAYASLRWLWRLRQDRSGVRGSGVLGPVLKELLGIGHAEGPGKQEALPAVAILASEQGQLFLLLDALGEGLDRERLAELHKGVDQRLPLLVVLQAKDERPVDLQRVDRESLQVSERGVPGAEVIDRDPHTEC